MWISSGHSFFVSTNIPAGNGSLIIDCTVDGVTTRLIQPSGPEEVASDNLDCSGLLQDEVVHSVVINNVGNSSDSSFVFVGLAVISNYAPETQPLLLNGLESNAAPSTSIAPGVPSLSPPVSSNSAPDPPPAPSNIASASQPTKESSTHLSNTPTPSPFVIRSITQPVLIGSSTSTQVSVTPSEVNKSSNLFDLF